MHVPVPLFATVMGIGGLGLAWRRAHEVLGLPAAAGEAILALAALAFVAVAALYLTKAVKHPAAVRHEFDHPVRTNFFPAMSIGLMILAGGALPHAPAAAEVLWVAAVALHLGFALAIMGRWISRNLELHAFNPAWFIPVVGNVLAPLVGVKLGHVEVSWFFFSVGLVFWLALFPILLYRVIFHDMMPARLVPTLVIFLAPPAVGFLSWMQLNGGVLDAGARLLFFTALFTALLLVRLSGLFLKVPFAVSWWAFTFPSAAMAIAAIGYHQAVGGTVSAVMAGLFLAAATVIVAVVSGRTVKALIDDHLFVPE
ncbi:SLAC1 anion channel family protein [Azospirillum halopraeferens]|uniref:SLAC1 anion channel family protein n=1 Tax=Azospirillum halopraeferens TaxID=34010 RepID=UPI00055883D2|nr:SLAC1 anion channel family protein [Azospirillum halopraeferens]